MYSFGLLNALFPALPHRARPTVKTSVPTLRHSPRPKPYRFRPPSTYLPFTLTQLQYDYPSDLQCPGAAKTSLVGILF